MCTKLPITPTIYLRIHTKDGFVYFVPLLMQTMKRERERERECDRDREREKEREARLKRALKAKKER